MSPELSQKLSAAVDRMPAFPKSVQKILEVSRDANTTPKDLIQIIDKDPVMTVKVLKVVNSAYYSLPKQITSINHAGVFLGINTIKNLALCIAAIGMLPKSNSAGFDMQQYLLHSLATAGIAKKLAADLDDAEPMECFMTGLLHDFGKVVFAQFMPDELRQAIEQSQKDKVSLHQALRDVVGADHVVVGAMLVEKWHFAPHLVHAIRSQHSAPGKVTDLIAAVFAGNQISKKLKFGFAGNAHIEAFPAAIESRLGGNLDQLIDRLGDLTPVFDEAQLFAQLGGES